MIEHINSLTFDSFVHSLWEPRVSIILTCIVSFSVVWAMGWFKNPIRSLLQAIIICGILYAIPLAQTSKGDNKDKPESDTTKPTENPPKTEDGPTGSEPVGVPLKERTGIDITIKFSGKGSENNISATVSCEGQNDNVTGNSGKEIGEKILGAMKRHLGEKDEKDEKCFGIVTFENANDIEGYVEYLKEEITEYHRSRGNLTEVKFNDKKTNSEGK